MTREYQLFFEAINSLDNTKARTLAFDLLNTLPEYFWHAPASSSGKYHPAIDLGEGGLARHSYNVYRWVKEFINDSAFGVWTDEQKEWLQIAALFHDGRKSGEQSNYDINPMTRFDHPILMANAVVKMDDSDMGQFIASAISTHMGPWTTSKYSDVVLTAPTTQAQLLVHMVDMIASRKLNDNINSF